MTTKAAMDAPGWKPPRHTALDGTEVRALAAVLRLPPRVFSPSGLAGELARSLISGSRHYSPQARNLGLAHGVRGKSLRRQVVHKIDALTLR